MSTLEIRIEPRHWEIVASILRRHVPDRDVWAFGSRVSGRVKPYSDLDLAIAGEGPLPFSTLDALCMDFEDSPLPFKVDVLDLAGISTSFRERIEAARVLVQSAEKALKGEASR
jgi:type I restriction enzyme S subunit